jgi:hypothetical protein
MNKSQLDNALSVELPFIKSCIRSIPCNRSLIIGSREDDLSVPQSSYFTSGFMSIPEHKLVGAVFEEHLWPFKESFFDLVVLDHILIYVDDLYGVMEQAFFSICDGGSLVLVDFLNSKRGRLGMKNYDQRAHSFSLLYIRGVLFSLGFVESRLCSFGFGNNLFYNYVYQLFPSIAPMYVGVFKKKTTSILPLPGSKSKILIPKQRGYATSIKSNLL